MEQGIASMSQQAAARKSTIFKPLAGKFDRFGAKGHCHFLIKKAQSSSSHCTKTIHSKKEGNKVSLQKYS
jgi:hypothetical protein